MALAKKTIEEEAVDAVRAQVRLSPIMSSDISCNDKSPSYDGEIYIHESAEQSKDNLIMVRVQVKGHEETNLEPHSTKHSVEITDLQNYQNNGGCLYFVVNLYQDKDTNKFSTKIYYQEFPPYKIFEILSQTKAKTKVSIEFKEFLPIQWKWWK